MASKKATALAKRNPMAGVLSHAAFQKRIVRARKGKGAYNRKAKHANQAFA